MANPRLRKELLGTTRGLHAAGAIDVRKLHRDDGRLPRGKKDKLLTWEETYRGTAREKWRTGATSTRRWQTESRSRRTAALSGPGSRCSLASSYKGEDP